MASVLIVDDDESFSRGLARFLRVEGHEVDVVASCAHALDWLGRRAADVLVIDLVLPDGNGLGLLEAAGRAARIIFITGNRTIRSIVGEIAGDRVSYLTKPVEPVDVLAFVNAVEPSGAEETRRIRRHFGLLLGESEPMREVYERIRQVGPTTSTVFVEGESGTGKELVAEAVHRASGRAGAYVPVNCGGLSRDLVTSQLFGHEKGSFTGAMRRHAGFFERAADGTLFLDEVAEMPPAMQTHLLRALETGRILRVGAESEIEVDARLVAATNREPAAAVREGALREDLFYRLRVFPITLPPLRDRGDDLLLLAEEFVAQFDEQNGTTHRLDASAEAVLRGHDWPGNVRELKHAVHRACIMAEDERVTFAGVIDDQVPAVEVEGIRAGRSIAEVERDLIEATLAYHAGDKKAAASSLGISLKTLYNRLNQYAAEDG